MSEREIDPDGVIAMSVATLAVADALVEDVAALQTAIDRASGLVPGAPAASAPGRGIAGDLAGLAGWARDCAIRYVDHEKPLHDLLSAGFWLPDLSALGWDGDRTATQNLERTMRSDEFASFPLGLTGAVLDRYRNWRFHVPLPGAVVEPVPVRLFPPADVVRNGIGYRQLPSGLLVEVGGAADPATRLPPYPVDGLKLWTRPGTAGLVGDPSFGRPPVWARTGSRVLAPIGVGLSLYSAGADQAEVDARYHPEYSSGRRAASIAANVATEGVGAAGGGLAGAYAGATLGASIGTMVPVPVVGTVVGGLVGGAVGGFVGSKAGKAAGRGVKRLAGLTGDGVSGAFDAIF